MTLMLKRLAGVGEKSFRQRVIKNESVALQFP